MINLICDYSIYLNLIFRNTITDDLAWNLSRFSSSFLFFLLSFFLSLLSIFNFPFSHFLSAFSKHAIHPPKVFCSSVCSYFPLLIKPLRCLINANSISWTQTPFTQVQPTHFINHFDHSHPPHFIFRANSILPNLRTCVHTHTHTKLETYIVTQPSILSNS